MKLDKQTLRNLLILVCGAIAFNFVLNNLHVIPQSVRFIISLLMPFIMGGVIAFIINVPMKRIEQFLQDKTEIKTKYLRVISIILALLIIFGIVAFVVFMVVPSFISALGDLLKNLPGAFAEMSDWLINLFEKYPAITDQIGSVEENFNRMLENLVTNFTGSMSGMVGMIFTILNTTIGTILKLIVGIVFAIYILLSKESLKHQIRKVLFAVVPLEKANYALDFWTLTNYIFSQFLTGQILEAFINGGLFFLAASIFNFPYKVVISVFLGFAALIPYFGALIGTAIAVLLVASQSLSQALLFMVVAMVIQQIDGNLIYPRVVGNQIGLPAIWVLVAVSLGASLWGVVGMIVMVPMASVLYALFIMWINRRLENRNIDVTQLEPRKMGYLFPKKDGSQDDHTI